jgi:hypothetical protein
MTDAPDVPPGRAFDPWRLRVLSAGEVAGLDTRAMLEYFARLALLAPTTHNTVPQRIRIDAARSQIHFALDRRAILPHSDPLGRQATISLGASLANTMIAAAASSIRVTTSLADVPEDRIRPAAQDEAAIVPIATLTLDRERRPDATRGIEWVHAMLRRKMIRAEYDERVKLPPPLAAELGSIVGALHPGLTLHVITDAPTLLALGKFQELADSTVINRVPFARELADWIVDHESDRPLGMRGREFGLSDDAARHFREGLAGAGSLLPDEAAGFAKAGGIGMRSSSAVLVVTAARDDAGHRLAAGRAFEELALRLVMADFCVAMHAGITEVDAPNLALRGRLRTVRRPTVVFRTGRPLRPADALRPHSARPSLEFVSY